MPGEPATMHHLAHHIDRLSPSQVEPELKPLLQDEQSGLLALLGRTDLDDAVILDPVEKAIARADGTESQGELARMAINGLVSSLEDEANTETITSRTERAGRIAEELIIDPGAKVSALLHLSSSATTAEHAITYADKAAEAARIPVMGPDGGSERVRLITWVAETSAENVVRAGKFAVAGVGHEQLQKMIHMTDALFQEGRKAAAEMGGPLQTLRNHVTMAMVKTAGQISMVAPELRDRLLADADTDTAALLNAYETNKQLKPGTKADSLARMGRDWVIQALPQDWDWNLSMSSSGQKALHIPKQAVFLFEAAAAHAQQLDPSLYESRWEKGYIDSAQLWARETAQALLQSDRPTAQKLLRVGFDLAVASDKLDSQVGSDIPDRQTIQTLGAIRHHAGQQTTVTGKFELYALAHQLELSQDKDYSMAEQGAQECLRRLASMESEPVRIDEIDHTFAQFMIESAAQDSHVRADQLRRFGGYISDPHLQKKLARQIRSVEARDRKREAAGSVTAKLAREILSS